MAELEVEISHTALEDLKALLIYLVERGAEVHVARRFVTRIENQCLTLSTFPNRGLKRDDIYPGLRLLPVERRSMIAYVIIDRTITITNVFHAGQDFETLLNES